VWHEVAMVLAAMVHLNIMPVPPIYDVSSFDMVGTWILHVSFGKIIGKLLLLLMCALSRQILEGRLVYDS